MGGLRQRRGEIVAGATALLRARPPLRIKGAFWRQAGQVHLTLAGNDAVGVFGAYFAAKGQRLSSRLQRKQRLIANVGVKARQNHRVFGRDQRHGAVGQIHILRQRMAVERDVVAVIGGGEGQHGVPVTIGGDGFLVGEGHTPGATGVNQDDSAIHFRRKDYPDAVWKLGYFRLTIELIKTGPAATPGQLEYHSERFLMAEHTPLAALDLTGRISTAGCSVNDATPALIKLPAAMLDHFGGVGKTTGDTPFALQLDCNSAVTISLRVDGAEPLSARGHGVLRNDATDDRAQGIGVQLLYHRQPVVLNHEMTLGSVSAGRFTLPLTARYYQTRSRITAGQSNSFIRFIRRFAIA